MRRLHPRSSHQTAIDTYVSLKIRALRGLAAWSCSDDANLDGRHGEAVARGTLSRTVLNLVDLERYADALAASRYRELKEKHLKVS
jgi:hypothetical protein